MKRSVCVCVCVCVCSARLDHLLLVLWHFRAVGFLYVQNVLTALSLISQRWKTFWTWDENKLLQLHPLSLLSGTGRTVGRATKNRRGMRSITERWRWVETCRKVSVRNKDRERCEIKPDEINPHIMLALWWSGSAQLSSRRACFHWKWNVSALICFHSNILRHSKEGPEVILSRWPQCREDQKLIDPWNQIWPNTCFWSYCELFIGAFYSG